MSHWKNALKLTLTILLITSSSIILADTNRRTAQSTPTPAPSKTPTIISSTQTENQVTPEPDSSQTLTAKTQADLSILTGNVQRPNGLLWHNDKLYASCSGDWTIYEIDINGGTTIQYIYGVHNSHTMYATNENNETSLWIPDFQSNSFTRISRGVTQVIASNLNGPWGITPIDQDTFAISNLSGDNITTITENGEVKEIISGLRSPAGITSDEEHLYIANTGSARRAIEWFPKTELLTQETPINAAESDNQTLVTGIQNATNLTIASDNYLYFSYALGTRGVVGRVNPDICRENGGCTSDEVEIVVYTELAAPLAGLTISPDMRLYIHSIYSPDIYWVQLNSTP